MPVRRVAGRKPVNDATTLGIGDCFCHEAAPSIHSSFYRIVAENWQGKSHLFTVEDAISNSGNFNTNKASAEIHLYTSYEVDVIRAWREREDGKF